MMKLPSSLLVAVCLTLAAVSAPTFAAEGTSTAEASKPATTPRIGGSPADAAFRQAQEKSGAAFRQARAACQAKPKADRSACMKEARAELQQARMEAKTAHDAAKKARR
jgi:hypothetical protein